MYNRHNFGTSQDVHSPLKNFHSDGISNRCQEDLNKQKRKMPELLRLNSIGEVSSVHHTPENKMKHTSGEQMKTSLHVSKTESFLSSLSKPIRRSMSSVNNFAANNTNFGGHNKRPSSVAKSHSFSEAMQRPKTDFIRQCSLGSSFDSSQRSKNCVSSPSKMSRLAAFGCGPVPFLNSQVHSMQEFKANGILPVNCTPGENKSKLTNSTMNVPFCMPLNHNVICSFTSPCRTSSTQVHNQSMCNIPAQSHKSVAGGKAAVPYSSVNNSSEPRKLTVTSQTICDIGTSDFKLPTSIPVSGTVDGMVHPDCSIYSTKKISHENESSVSTKALPSEREVHSSPQSVSESMHCDQCANESTRNCKECKESSMESSHQDPQKHISLSSVLLTPRKVIKKGRPSSKKQKKRQREKQKQGTHSSQVNESFNIPENAIDSCHRDSCDVTFLSSDELNSSVDSSPNSQHSQQRQSTPVKVQSKYTTVSQFVVTPDSDDDVATDDGDGSDENTDWSTECSFGGCISPIKGAGLSVALNLDAIFKKKDIPSLKSVLNVDDSESDSDSPTSQSSAPHAKKGFHLTVSLSCSEDDSHEGGLENSGSSPFADHAVFGFTMGLCMDNLITKKSTSESRNDANPVRTIRDLVNDFTSLECHQESNGRRASLGECEMMNEINARWNKNYPTAGSRCCTSVTSETIADPSIKVHFAQEPHLCTVHEVDSEERGGTWHLLALDRERFGRRIAETGSIIAPVLETSHRMKILERNKGLENRLDLGD